jgi:hypothetical protein
MLTQPEPACLLIADIAGYTGYLAGVELDHAQDILADLMNTVVASLRPTLRLAKLEGDAAFAYVMTERVDPSVLQDVVERTYFAFRRRLRDIAQSSTCDCDACTRMPGLDLKVVAHHGLVVKHKVAGRDELAGADVIVVHRLLKNRVDELVGSHAYALYTDACIRAMDADPVAMGLREHHELLDVGGDTTCWVRDLEALWQAELARTTVRVEAADAALTVVYDVEVPPAIAWEWVTSPARRPVWGVGITGVVESSPSGRRGAGTTNHCIHGKDAIVEEVLDWRPFEHFTTRSQMPDPAMPRILMTDVFVPLPDGRTRIEVRIGKPKPRDRAVFEQLGPMYQSLVEASGAQLQALLRDVAAELAASAADEPVIEASQGRHLLAS